jgi:ATP-dependent Clp protease protease subunit
MIEALTQQSLTKGPTMALHTINFMTDVNLQSLAGLQNATLNAMRHGATEITIFFSCSGGNTDAGFTAYHFLQSLPIPVTMHCVGNVESMGIIMFLAANTRIATTHAKFKIHPLHWDFPVTRLDHDRLNEYSESLDFDAERYATIFEERTKTAKKQLKIREVLRGKAVIFGATEAIAIHLATSTADAAIPASASGEALRGDAARTTWWV